MLISELAGRKVGILGVGAEGRAAWRALRQRLPRQRLELFSEGDVDVDFAAKLAACGHPLHRGPLVEFNLGSFDVLVRSPGVSPYREELRRAGEAGVRFTTGSNIWFAEHPDAKTICITGTKGKSTTTALTAHLLRAAGLRVGMAGNIGQPLLGAVADDCDWWVIELSSYQLADFEGRPDVAAILNLFEDHLDWHGDLERYRLDKLRLAGLVRGTLAADFSDPQLRVRLAGHPAVRWFNDERGWHVEEGRLRRGGSDRPRLELPQLRGRHNLNNLAAALTLAECVTAMGETVYEALESFHGLPHRLQELGKRDGVKYMDDSLSTTPASVLAALEALKGERVTLLIGGLDRGVDWSAAAARFRACLPYAMIALPDNGPHILSELERQGLIAPGGMHRAANLEMAMKLAREVTPVGGVVLLSPGAPSFPHFTDYRARGAAFARAAGFNAG